LSSPVSQFLEDECIVGAEESVSKTSLYASWVAWCEYQGQRNSGDALFFRDLYAANVDIRVVHPHGKPRVVEGVSVR
jgi:phage/plasmid-associated DNA primase